MKSRCGSCRGFHLHRLLLSFTRHLSSALHRPPIVGCSSCFAEHLLEFPVVSSFQMKRAEEDEEDEDEGSAKRDGGVVFRPPLDPSPSSRGHVFQLNWTEDDEVDEDEEDESEKRKWDEMDEDILIVIFQKIDLEDLLLGVPFVCRSWREASKHPLCWRSLNFRSWERLFRRYFSQPAERIVLDFSKLLRYVVDKTGDNLRSIVFPRRDVTDRTLLYVSQRCPRLKSLDFQGRCDISKGAFCKALCNWKELEVINLITPPLLCKETISEMGKCCENLVQLRTRGLISEEEVFAVASELRNLRVLNLSFSSLTNNGLLTLLNECRALEYLDISNCSHVKIDDEILDKASHLKDFKYGCIESDDEEDTRPVRGLIYEEYVFGSDGSYHGEVHMVFS
ncbi:F-box/LRR-repeat protein At3g48880-like isoform X1 [Nymphaea colorata]|nr:F-box/LRR-repeat protein At3g48880-like isoform X1 [Nymphaea colorata]